MKKIGILLISLILLACEKKENLKVNQTTNNVNVQIYIIEVNSNYKHSYVSIENMTTYEVIKRYNTAVDSTKNCPITFVLNAINSDKYKIYTHSTKNSTDTTLFMTDDKLTWNYLSVKKNGLIVYQNTDSVGIGGLGSNRITSNEYKINY
jgi:hypothetical protein